MYTVLHQKHIVVAQIAWACFAVEKYLHVCVHFRVYLIMSIVPHLAKRFVRLS
jgi:hypothetical protein